ncbi:hypothetical protein [Aequorivita sp. CIP111184]|uniref:hypothetical protein n=1 Tax=Aequorivita sp. CIP111184 TaxID=2211356 RepID=UPI000DBBF499|nr:hypothetical protein [Aequorivita sp. CIP111184]SRX55278.1 hypothetical protein AEQU1_02300 [Aequorivita sp. CIP111184]
MILEVILERIDHRANKAIPKTVNNDPIKTPNSDWSTPQIIKIIIKQTKMLIRLMTFFMSLPLTFFNKLVDTVLFTNLVITKSVNANAAKTTTVSIIFNWTLSIIIVL